jgi:hypothetical protein
MAWSKPALEAGSVSCCEGALNVTTVAGPPGEGGFAGDEEVVAGVVAAVVMVVEVPEIAEAFPPDAVEPFAQAVAEGRAVILDRTVDTLLAHAHAMGRLQWRFGQRATAYRGQ